MKTVESGTAAARRKALEEYAEEAKKSHTTSPKMLQEDAPVLKRGKAANTRAKLEKMSSEERVLEKEVDVNTPKSGTALERRAKFEEKARQASVDEGNKSSLCTPFLSVVALDHLEMKSALDFLEEIIDKAIQQ